MTAVDLLALAPKGELIKTGYSGRQYYFGFSWLARLHLETVYGKGLERISEENDMADYIANVLLAGLKAKAANNIPTDFSREHLYALLDDLSEKDTTEVFEAAKFSLGFTNRILGLSDEDVRKITELALNQNSPTGTAS